MHLTFSGVALVYHQNVCFSVADGPMLLSGKARQKTTSPSQQRVPTWSSHQVRSLKLGVFFTTFEHKKIFVFLGASLKINCQKS